MAGVKIENWYGGEAAGRERLMANAPSQCTHCISLLLHFNALIFRGEM